MIKKMQPQNYKYRGYDKLEKVVTPGNGTSGRIFVPKNWEGSTVAVIKLD